MLRISKINLIAIRVVILLISIITWVILIYNPGRIMTIEHCHVSTAGPSAPSLKMLLDMNPFSNQLLGWGLMVIAMMLPKLIIPIEYIYESSLKRNRLIMSILFVLGYLVMWLFAGVFMVALIIGFNLWMPQSFVPAIIIGLIAILWQYSPIKQYCLNQGHNHWSLPAFGWPALQSSFSLGIIHGVWCIGSGWALMLFPMLLPVGHNLTMLLVTFIMISEHFENPRYPKWEFNPRLRLLKIILFQAKMRVMQLNSSKVKL